MEDLREALSSNSKEDVLDAIFTLQGIENYEASKEVKGLVFKLVNHHDPNIREEAINLSAIHWGDASIYATLVRMISFYEKDQSVLSVICFGLGSLVVRGSGDRDEVANIIFKIIEDDP